MFGGCEILEVKYWKFFRFFVEFSYEKEPTKTNPFLFVIC